MEHWKPQARLRATKVRVIRTLNTLDRRAAIRAARRVRVERRPQWLPISAIRSWTYCRRWSLAHHILFGMNLSFIWARYKKTTKKEQLSSKFLLSSKRTICFLAYFWCSSNEFRLYIYICKLAIIYIRIPNLEDVYGRIRTRYRATSTRRRWTYSSSIRACSRRQRYAAWASRIASLSRTSSNATRYLLTH